MPVEPKPTNEFRRSNALLGRVRGISGDLVQRAMDQVGFKNAVNLVISVNTSVDLYSFAQFTASRSSQELARHAILWVLDMTQESMRDRLSPAAVASAYRLMRTVIFDDAPSPQLSATGDGGFQVNWVVGRDAITMDIFADGDVDVTLFDRVTRQYNNRRLVIGNAVDQHFLGTVRTKLEAMASRVLFRAY